MELLVMVLAPWQRPQDTTRSPNQECHDFHEATSTNLMPEDATHILTPTTQASPLLKASACEAHLRPHLGMGTGVEWGSKDLPQHGSCMVMEALIITSPIDPRSNGPVHLNGCHTQDPWLSRGVSVLWSTQMIKTWAPRCVQEQWRSADGFTHTHT